MVNQFVIKANYGLEVIVSRRWKACGYRMGVKR